VTEKENERSVHSNPEEFSGGMAGESVLGKCNEERDGRSPLEHEGVSGSHTCQNCNEVGFWRCLCYMQACTFVKVPRDILP